MFFVEALFIKCHDGNFSDRAGVALPSQYCNINTLFRTILLLFQIPKPHNPSHIHWHSIYFMTEKYFFLSYTAAMKGVSSSPLSLILLAKLPPVRKCWTITEGRSMSDYSYSIQVLSTFYPNKLNIKSRVNSSISKDSLVSYYFLQ